MTVYLVGAGPGDPGLLTRRGAELLGRADVVVHDRLVDPALLALAPADAEIIDVGKRPGGRHPDQTAAGDAPQDEINDLLVHHGTAGRTVVRLKGGDPFLFGRGGEEAQALAAAGVAWEVVPGVSSALAAPAAAGVPVTHRGLSTSVTVVTGHKAITDGADRVDWAALARSGGTLVVLMGVATRTDVARQLLDGGRAPGTPVAIVEWATTPAQRVHRTTLRELAGDPAGPGDPVGASAPEISSPAVIVIGAVAGLDLGPGATGAGTGSGPRPLAGLRVVVTRTAEQSRPLAEALRDQGARVVVVPVHRQADTADGGEALRRAAAGVAAFDWVAFTSANAVHRFVPRLRDARDLGRCRVAAVGPATAAALAGYHVAVDRQPADRGRPATAAGLAQAIGPAPATGGSVLFARAADARPDLAEGLRAGGWTVTDVEAYRLVPAPPPSAAARAEVAGADAIVFASPNTLTGWLSLADDRGIAMPVPPAVICVGPVTAETAGAAGLEVAVIADAPSVAGLVAALVAWRHGTAR